MSPIRIVGGGLLLLSAIVALTAEARGDVAADILALTGGQQTRIVWVRRGEQDHHFSVWGFDTSEGVEHQIAPEAHMWQCPMISSSGQRVLWSDCGWDGGGNIYIANWNGSNARTLISGGATLAGAFEDPPGTEWVVAMIADKLYRCRIDDTSVSELWWDRISAGVFWSWTSDGQYGAGQYPWPTLGVSQHPNGTSDLSLGGCGQSITSDGLHMFHFNPDHQGVQVYDVNGTSINHATTRYVLCASDAPGVNGGLIQYPNFVRNAGGRFMTTNGPQGPSGATHHGNVLFAKFDATWSAMEGWVQVTVSPTSDTGTYGWIGNLGPTPPVILTSAQSVAYVGGSYTYAISASGNPDPTLVVSGLPNWLTFDGTDTISGTPSASDTGTSPTITVTATNAEGSDTQVFSIEVYDLIAPEGSILREYWTGIGGGVVTDLTSNANYPDNPTGSDTPTSFAGPSNWGDSYGQRFRGYVYPPESGTYTFWIASDDASELWVSSDESPSNASKIAWVTEWTNPQEWGKEANQQSAAITLQAGSRYYVEALHKEGGGGDHLTVGWQRPSGSYERPIPGLRLSPWSDLDPLPSITSSAPTEAMADMEYSYVITAAGIPAPALSVSALPDWLSFDGTDTLSGMPSGSDVGLTPTITVTAINSEGMAAQEFQIDVSPFVGEAPVITSTAPTTVVANSVYTYTITASGRPAPTFLASGLPLWLTFDGIDTLSGTPTMSDVGASPTITVTAANSEGSDTQTLSITVAADPNAPSITVLSPVAGDVWYVGTQPQVRWTTRNLTNVKIYYNTGSNSDWHVVDGTEAGLMDTAPNWGAFAWEIPPEASSQCVLRLEGYFGAAPTMSEQFEIRSVTDLDGDGMDDGWELDYIGEMSQDGSGDFDGDGSTDLDEFLHGTDPSDPNDPLRPAAGTSSSAGMSCTPGQNARATDFLVVAALVALALPRATRRNTSKVSHRKGVQR